MNSKVIDQSISINEAFIKSKIGESFDTKYRHLVIPAFNNTDAIIVYISGMVDVMIIDEVILKPLMRYSNLPGDKVTVKSTRQISTLKDQAIFASEIRESKTWDDICTAVVEGDTVLFVDQCDTALILNTKKYSSRPVDEPGTESDLRAPKDGFIENIQVNAELIRRRIKDFGLRFDNMKIGERTKTIVSIVYIKDLVNESLLDEVKSRLNRIKVDSILASAYIEEIISDAPYSLFSTISSTERPDKVCAAILEGRIVIMVDNTPFALIIPTVFWQNLQSAGDYYDRYYLATFIRLIRILALVISISASSIYVLLTSFHQEMLPTALALKIATGRNGVPFPAVIEIGFMEIVLEIMKEAGLRMPRALGQTVSIVGTLVIGEAAVNAGIVGPTAVIFMSIAAISSFAIPSLALSNAVRLVKYPLLFITSFVGLLGYLAGMIAILMHLLSLRSFGTPYLSPVIPFDKNSIKDVVLRFPWWKMSQRPGFVRAKETKRQSSDLRPKPPSQN